MHEVTVYRGEGDVRALWSVSMGLADIRGHWLSGVNSPPDSTHMVHITGDA